MRNIMLSTLILLSASSSLAEAHPSLPSIKGRWTIYRNDLVPADVQAYVKNDPSVLGNKLVVRADKVYWIGRGDFNETCRRPSVRSGPKRNFDIFCDGKQKFGPDASDPNFAITKTGVIIAKWYDGLILYLKRRP